MRTHYLEVRDERGPSRSPHPSRHYEIAAAVIQAVHRENVRRREGGATPGIAIAFPGFIRGNPFPMGVVRAFGTSAEIRALARGLQAQFQDADRIAVGRPEEVSGERMEKVAAFVRDRRSEKETVAFHDRAVRRAQAKAMARVGNGEVLLKLPKTSGERELDRLEALAARDQDARRSVTLHSSSTGSRFSMWVAPVTSANGDPSGAVDSYGLSRREATVALPHF